MYRAIREHQADDLSDDDMRHHIDHRIKPLITRWPYQLGLSMWHLSYSYSRSSAEDDEHRSTDQWGTVMDVRADWRYRQAYITIYMPEVVNMTDDELEYAFVHEHCHILVNQLRGPRLTYEGGSAAHAHEEAVVTHLAQALLWVRDSVLGFPTRWCDCRPGECTHKDDEDATPVTPTMFGDAVTKLTDNEAKERLSGDQEDGREPDKQSKTPAQPAGARRGPEKASGDKRSRSGRARRSI